MNQPIRLSVQTFAAIILWTVGGCTTIQPDWKWPGKDKPVTPEVVMPIWTDTVLHQPGKPGVRGFGGRVFFYEQEGGEPIKVDGSLTVYVFDGEQLDVQQAKPLRKFVFTPEQLAKHHSKSDLGDSYSVWIPWEKVGGPSKALSLITRFDGRNGGTAISDASNKLLPGISPALANKSSEPPENAQAPSPVRQVSFETETLQGTDVSANGNATASTGDREAKMKTYSLALPSHFQRHLRSGDALQSDEGPATTDGLQRLPPAGSRSAIPMATPVENTTAESVNATDQWESLTTSPSPAIDSSPSKYPARKAPVFPPSTFQIRKQPIRATWQSGLEPTPRSVMTKLGARSVEAESQGAEAVPVAGR
ncbi:hypothetical protein Pan14r_26770 [Crateriforma conspicua]|uniref:Uncharacterized protein n=1 Tax=Crateriforma conspicua TaxID=2527996 RepID=A0A5C5Y744_9PLAN|nr:hypothetical protein [Crateriforma conspicua]QDV64972.1 hypothetical protein Mal65_41410 [Crateriforma conspicua]TWT70371.1 hypothetical protein Pan14r_26770 [Crateriforma conspicua]